MKKFSFRLQTILDLALKLEEQQLGRTKEAEQQLVLEQQRLEELSGKHRDVLAQRQSKASLGCTVQELLELQSYLDRLEREIEQQRLRVVEANENYQHELNELLVRMRQRKMLDNLRARALDEFRKKQLKEEQLILDELALVRYWYQEHR